jgi:hypothetical protein
MARLPDGRISKHDVHGYRVTVGRKADGKPRLFWLGKNEEPGRYARPPLPRGMAANSGGRNQALDAGT